MNALIIIFNTLVLLEKKTYKPFVELKFGPKWSYISTVRNFIFNFLAITINDKKWADCIAMAVNELVENAIKYSDREGIEIKLRITDNNETIHTKVINHVAKEEYKNLNIMLKKMLKEPPIDSYINRMKVAAVTPGNKSMMGLARIRYETGADVTCTYSRGYVTVNASFSEKNSRVCR